MSWGFEGDRYLAISIETRKEKGEQYTVRLEDRALMARRHPAGRRGADGNGRCEGRDH